MPAGTSPTAGGPPARATGSPSSDAVAPAAVAMANLRAFVTLMVLLQHAILAYDPYAPVPQASLAAEPRSWLARPIVDDRRSAAILVLATFNDIFGMALMFFLSGLFVRRGLERHGARAFLRRRVIRLGVPFLAAATVLTPLAYYPSYLVTTPTPSIGGFRDEWLAMGLWPGAAGPAWFLWLLLVYDALAVVLLAWSPACRERATRLGAYAGRHPLAFFVRLVVVSAAAFIPLILVFGPARWDALGPFKLQTSRVLHYFVYFLAGIAVGSNGIEHGLLAPTGGLARRWPTWRGIALVAYPVAVGIGAVALAPGRSLLVWGPIGGTAFALSCGASCFAVLAAFVRFGRWQSPWLRSLQENAYGMYVVHYVFVTWLQYACLSLGIPALLKGALVFAGAVASSWVTTAALRRAPLVARVM